MGAENHRLIQRPAIGQLLPTQFHGQARLRLTSDPKVVKIGFAGRGNGRFPLQIHQIDRKGIGVSWNFFRLDHDRKVLPLAFFIACHHGQKNGLDKLILAIPANEAARGIARVIVTEKHLPFDRQGLERFGQAQGSRMPPGHPLADRRNHQG
ncbi:MAG: hypothetical protein WC789_06285 [Lentisphaeria bacterium]